MNDFDFVRHQTWRLSGPQHRVRWTWLSLRSTLICWIAGRDLVACNIHVRADGTWQVGPDQKVIARNVSLDGTLVFK